MKKYNNLKLVLAGLLLITAACKTEIDVPAASKGSADFTKYIAIGNSLTAGYADGGLYLAGQSNSYPSIIAAQMKAVGGGDFKQPLFTEVQSNGSGYLKLTALVNGSPTLTPVTDKLAYRDADKHFTKYTEEINNLGVPGMRLDFAFVPQVSLAINYFERLLPTADVGTKTYFEYIQGRNHTFFSSWIGNNDVLGWATNGGVNEDAKTALTDKQIFAGAYSNLINALTAQGQKGVVATIPDVTSIPFFNTVTVTAINAGLKAKPETANYQLIISALNPTTGLHAARVATAADLIILSFDTSTIGVNGYGLSPLNPISDKQVLDAAEVLKAKDYVTSYNNSIKSIASSKGLAVFDAFSFLNTLPIKHMGENGQPYMGIFIDGVNISSAFITGNAFSLDGVHLTPKGYAVVANQFIKAINTKYGSSLNTVSLSNYPAVKFP